MKKWTFRSIAEVVGLFGVIASLVFVGFEVRQNSIATRAATNATVADSYRELNLTIASSPALAGALISVGSDPKTALPEDRLMALSLYRALFHIWSNAHRQWLIETLDEELYQSVVSEISTYSLQSNNSQTVNRLQQRSATLLWAWNSEKFIFNSEFRQFVENILTPPNTQSE